MLGCVGEKLFLSSSALDVISGKAFLYHEFSVRAFLWVAAKTELSVIFGQSVPVGRCKDGASTNFLAVCSCGSLYGAITNFLAGRSCGSLEGLSYHEFSGSASLWVAVWTELSRIF